MSRPEPDVYTPLEAAARLRVSEATVREWVRLGRLARLPLRLVRIPRWSVERLIAGGHNDDGGSAWSGRSDEARGWSAASVDHPDIGEARLPDDPPILRSMAALPGDTAPGGEGS